MALREACLRRQYVQCLTLMAQWQSEAPTSPRRRRIAGELERLPFYDVDTVDRLAGFFDASPVEEPVTPESLRRDASLYRVFYWSGAPFHRDALQSRLQACSDPGCARALRGGPRDSSS